MVLHLMHSMNHWYKAFCLPAISSFCHFVNPQNFEQGERACLNQRISHSVLHLFNSMNYWCKGILSMWHFVNITFRKCTKVLQMRRRCLVEPDQRRQLIQVNQTQTCLKIRKLSSFQQPMKRQVDEMALHQISIVHGGFNVDIVK